MRFLMPGANHADVGPSTFPFGVFGPPWDGTMDIVMSPPSRGDTVVGHDVWLGYSALVLPGVKIGHGAVVAAASVVAGDVPPYTVVAGNPARVIRSRLSDEDVARLLRAAWWDWPIELVTANARALMAGTAAELERIAPSTICKDRAVRHDPPMPIHRRHTNDAERYTRELSEAALASLQLTLGMPAPRSRLADHPVAADVAASVIRDELQLDGSARLNLATFVTTWMEPQAQALMAECFDKNMIDKDEYPQTAELERRCVSILADLWHAPASEGIGCSTTGSSEACMLGALALKRRWQHRRRRAGKPTDRPNLVVGANAQICWEKFCNYFEVEPRLIPMQRERFHLGVPEAVARCDENTIGVVGILGSTFDGSYEPISELAAALDELEQRTGMDVPIHVDGASGAMIAPFLDRELVWDFQLPRVASINTSGHKYGRVYPGVGWIVWRNEESLPEELVFRVSYLGGDTPTFTLNFSRPGSQVVAQYYEFLRLGFEGYRAVQQACRDAAMRLSGQIAALGRFRLITDGSELPVFAFTTADDVRAFDVYDVSRRLRERGWLVPAYPFAPDREDLHVLRVVVRTGNVDLLDLLVADIARLLPQLERQPGPLAGPSERSFHH